MLGCYILYIEQKKAFTTLHKATFSSKRLFLTYNTTVTRLFELLGCKITILSKWPLQRCILYKAVI